ncbi:GOLPH3/VPS74 family protein [Streptomyces luteireticuli]|uniref:GPP34 family phosphoprotein n=1 Tax=Streptomyces luteireticuli TaxID=173858 RepID=A0ABN0YWM7_9ACTN
MTVPGDEHLALAEELLLLALVPASGRVSSGLRVRYALAAAELMEQELTGAVRPEADGKRFTATAPSGTAQRPLTRGWLGRHARRSLITRYGDRLAERGAVRRQHRRLAGVLPATRYPLLRRDLAAEVRSRVEGAAQGGADAAADPRAARLGALLAAVGLDRRVFPGPAHRGLRRRLAERAAADRVARQAHRAVRAARAAAHGGG